MSWPRVGISGRALEGLRAHGERDYPHEACGLLLGRQEPAAIRIDEALAVQNLNTERATDRYALDSRGYLEADRRARATGRDIVGIYHSHPDHPARPSELDRSQGYPGWIYLIVAVERGKAMEQGGFMLSGDGLRFHDLELGEL